MRERFVCGAGMGPLRILRVSSAYPPRIPRASRASRGGIRVGTPPQCPRSLSPPRGSPLWPRCLRAAGRGLRGAAAKQWAGMGRGGKGSRGRTEPAQDPRPCALGGGSARSQSRPAQTHQFKGAERRRQRAELTPPPKKIIKKNERKAWKIRWKIRWNIRGEERILRCSPGWFFRGEKRGEKAGIEWCRPPPPQSFPFSFRCLLPLQNSRRRNSGQVQDFSPGAAEMSALLKVSKSEMPGRNRLCSSRRSSMLSDSCSDFYLLQTKGGILHSGFIFCGFLLLVLQSFSNNNFISFHGFIFSLEKTQRICG
ncbi:uncharacterized protein LOC135457374 [Zonotrichia leucophrys gambelii]|uniref:uncharacterized protein LOC135457374 n=1 Tax=Zonotrichia leucophrys gambelii TaxID=257770 RepID=UPI003140C1C9